jgi:hypothetical protein
VHDDGAGGAAGPGFPGRHERLTLLLPLEYA